MKHIVYAFFLVCLLQAFAQDCNNPLLSAFNLSGLDSPESGQGLPYCSNLQNNETCCSNRTVSSFQSLLDQQTQGLYNLIAARDLYLSSLNDKFLSRWSDLSDDINEALNNIGVGQFTQLPNSAQLQRRINTFYNISDELNGIQNDFYWNLRQYQEARTKCLNVVLEVQASIWCLACDPYYGSQGVNSNGSINFSDDLCNNISNACYPFLQEAVQFNPVLRAQRNYLRLLNLSNTLQYYAGCSDSDSDYYQYTSQDYPASNNGGNNSSNQSQQSISSQELVFVPNNCSSQNCSWQCQNLFSNNLLNATLLANGAGLLGRESNENNSTASNRTRNNNRNNNNSTFTPDLNGTGLNINAQADPGNVFWLLNDRDYRRHLERSNRRRRNDYGRSW